MPPKKKLPDEVIADFEKWIAMGAADPRDGSGQGREVAKSTSRRAASSGRSSRRRRRRRRRSRTPPGRSGDIDRFLLAELEAKGLKPVADADRADADPPRLLRPDRPAADARGGGRVRQGLRGQTAVGLEAVVDQLLASPQFGERWGRHWLDVARYAESSGKAANFAYPHAWRYRDYVIAAFNARQALRPVRPRAAGRRPAARQGRQGEGGAPRRHRLPGHRPQGRTTSATRGSSQMDVADEQIDVTFQAFHGLTVGLRPLPRSQVRSDPAEGLLRPGRHLPQHRDVLRHHPHHPEQPSQPADRPAEGRRRDDRPGTALGGSRGRRIEKQIRGPEEIRPARLTGTERVHPDHLPANAERHAAKPARPLRIRRHAEAAGDGRPRGAACRRTAGSTSAASWTSPATGSSAASRRC